MTVGSGDNAIQSSGMDLSSTLSNATCVCARACVMYSAEVGGSQFDSEVI